MFPAARPAQASARATIFLSSSHARASPSGSGGTMITVWKFPSPTWPTIGAVRPDARMSSFAPRIASFSREIGTIASVAIPLCPGFSARHAQ